LETNLFEDDDELMTSCLVWHYQWDQ